MLLIIFFPSICEKKKKKKKIMSEKEGEIPYHLFTPAQQETIKQFVPEKFFGDAEVDAIQMTLDLLPSFEEDENFDQKLEDLITGESEALDAISRNLNKDLLDNYSTYLKSMQMISELNHQLNLATSNIRQARNVMAAAESEICDHPRNFFRQIQKKKNLALVIELVSAVNSIYKSTDELNKALQERDFIKALNLCLKPSELSQDLRSLSGIEDLVSSLQSMYSRVIDEMDKALLDMTKQFDRNVYGNLMHSYQQINKIASVPQKLQEAFLEEGKKREERILFQADLTRPKPYKAIYDKIIDSCCEISKVHQQILLWHRGAAEYESIRKPIEDMAKVIWDQSESRVTQLLLKAPLDKLNFDAFDGLLKSTAGFIQFGATVVDLPGGQLTNAMDTISTRYFKTYHRGSMDAVREILETDSWARCPSDPVFERHILSLSIPIKENTDAFGDTALSSGMTSVNIPPAYEFDLGKTTNSCSNFIKMIHNYLTLIKAVPSLAGETFKGIQQLVEFYSLSALHLFLRTTPIKPLELNPGGKIVFSNQYSVLLSPDGMQCISRIVHHLQESPVVFPNDGQVSTKTIEALQQVMAASDDMKCVAWYLKSVRSVLEESLPEGSLGALRRFYSDVVSIFLLSFSKFCCQFYGPVMLSLNEFTNQLRNTKWVLNEPPNNPDQFTATWAERAQKFINRFNKAEFLPEEKDDIFTCMWIYTCFVLINEFSTITKVNAEGRTAMLSDYRNMAHDFIQMTDKRIQVDNSWVTGFVQAYFLSQEDFRKWCQDNCKRYTMNHLLSIVETGLSDGLKRTEKKDLSTFVRSLYKEAA